MPITQRYMHITWIIRIYFELCASNAIILKHLVKIMFSIQKTCQNHAFH